MPDAVDQGLRIWQGTQKAAKAAPADLQTRRRAASGLAVVSFRVNSPICCELSARLTPCAASRDGALVAATSGLRTELLIQHPMY